MGVFINKKEKLEKTANKILDKYTCKIPGYEHYNYDEMRAYDTTYIPKYANGYDVYRYYQHDIISNTWRNEPVTRNNNIINSTNLTNINMNTTVSNQEQQVESAVKYLTEKREKPSNIIEIDKKEYQKIVEELAELKAKIKTNQEVIRVEETEYDEEQIITYIGKDKAIADLSKDINNKRTEIRDLQSQFEILNEEISKEQESKRREKSKFEKLTIERLEDEFEKRNKNLKANYKSEIKKLEKIIDGLNDDISEANNRNKILADLNTEFRTTLIRILKFFGTKKNWLFRKFDGLKVIMDSENEWYVGNNNKSIYVNCAKGSSYLV